MHSILHSLQLFFVAAMMFLGLGSLMTAGSVRLLRPRIDRLEPRLRHRMLLFLMLLPVLISLLLLFSASFPSLLSLALPSFDHCALHDDPHAHLCFTHRPSSALKLSVIAGLALFLAYGMGRAISSLAQAIRATRLLESLVHTSEARRDLGVVVVETPQPLCVTAGFLRPVILMSRGLLDALKEGEREVVLLHERAHVHRRDAFTSFISRALAWIHLPSVARWLHTELQIAAEQACDESAAAALGDRLLVASAILSVERKMQGASFVELGPLSSSFGECGIKRRVESLLLGPRMAGSLRWMAVVCAGCVFIAIAASDKLHHFTETLLSLLVQ